MSPVDSSLGSIEERLGHRMLPWLPSSLTPFPETHKALWLFSGDSFQSAIDGYQLRIHRDNSFKFSSAKLAGDNGAKAVGICLRG